MMDATWLVYVRVLCNTMIIITIIFCVTQIINEIIKKGGQHKSSFDRPSMGKNKR